MDLKAGQYVAIIQFAVGTPHNISLQFITDLCLLIGGTILVQIDQCRIPIRMAFQPGRINLLPPISHISCQSGHDTFSGIVAPDIIQIVSECIPVTDFERKVKVFIQLVTYTQTNRNSGRYERVRLVVTGLPLSFRM